jgi:hypothetical protein
VNRPSIVGRFSLVPLFLGVAAGIGCVGPRPAPRLNTLPPAHATTRDFLVARSGRALTDGRGLAFGDLAAGERVELLAVRSDGALEVRFAGAIETEGFVPAGHLGLRAQRAVSVAATPAGFLAPGDLVELREPQIFGTTASAVVHLRVRPSTYVDDPRLLGLEGTVPADALAVADHPRDTPGPAAYTNPRIDVPLIAAPGLAPFHTLKANEWGHLVYPVGREGALTRVRVGQGPYLDVWTTAPVGDPGEIGGLGVGDVSLPDYPLALTGKGQLYCVAPGATVSLDGAVVARVRSPIWGRAGEAGPSAAPTLELRLADKHGLTVRGTVEAATLTPVADADAARCR